MSGLNSLVFQSKVAPIILQDNLTILIHNLLLDDDLHFLYIFRSEKKFYF